MPGKKTANSHGNEPAKGFETDIENLKETQNKLFVTNLRKNTEINHQKYDIFWNYDSHNEQTDWLRFCHKSNRKQNKVSQEDKQGPKIHLSIARNNHNNENSNRICQIITEEFIKAGVKSFKILPPDSWKYGRNEGKEVTIYEVQGEQGLVKAINEIERRLKEESYILGKLDKHELKIKGTECASFRDDRTVIGYYADSRKLPSYHLSPEVYTNLRGESLPSFLEINSVYETLPLNINISESHQLSETDIVKFRQVATSSEFKKDSEQFHKKFLNYSYGIFNALFIGMLPHEGNNDNFGLEKKLAWLYQEKIITENFYENYSQILSAIFKQVSEIFATVNEFYKDSGIKIRFTNTSEHGFEKLNGHCEEVLFLGMRDLWYAMKTNKDIEAVKEKFITDLTHQCLKEKKEDGELHYAGELNKDMVDQLIDIGKVEIANTVDELIDIYKRQTAEDVSIKDKLLSIINNKDFWHLQTFSMIDDIPKTITKMQYELSVNNNLDTQGLIHALVAKVPSDNQGHFFSKLTRSKLAKEFYRLIKELDSNYDRQDALGKLDNFIQKQQHEMNEARVRDRVELGTVAKQNFKH